MKLARKLRAPPSRPPIRSTALYRQGHHHSSSGCVISYERFERLGESSPVNHLWGVPLHSLFDERVGAHKEGAIFRVTVDLILSGRKCVNPFQRKRKRARRSR